MIVASQGWGGKCTGDDKVERKICGILKVKDIHSTFSQQLSWGVKPSLGLWVIYAATGQPTNEYNSLFPSRYLSASQGPGLL